MNYITSSYFFVCCKNTLTNVSFEDFMAVMIHVKVFWVVMLCSAFPGHLWNISILPQHYTAWQLRRPQPDTEWWL